MISRPPEVMDMVMAMGITALQPKHKNPGSFGGSKFIGDHLKQTWVRLKEFFLIQGLSMQRR